MQLHKVCVSLSNKNEHSSKLHHCCTSKMPPQSNLQKNKLKALVINQLYKRLKTLVTHQFTIRSIIQFIPLTYFFQDYGNKKLILRLIHKWCIPLMCRRFIQLILVTLKVFLSVPVQICGCVII